MSLNANTALQTVEINRGSLCCTVLITVTIGSIFAFYAFGKPDTIGCYAYKLPGEVVSYEASPLPPSDDETEYMDVGAEFHAFFLMGFLIMCSQLVYIFFGVLYLVRQRHPYKKAAQISILITGVCTFAWIIMGSVFRWRAAGQACSEDYLFKSGRFMKVYLILMYVVWPIFLCCGICAILADKKARQHHMVPATPR